MERYDWFRTRAWRVSPISTLKQLILVDAQEIHNYSFPVFVLSANLACYLNYWIEKGSDQSEPINQFNLMLNTF